MSSPISPALPSWQPGLIAGLLMLFAVAAFLRAMPQPRRIRIRVTVSPAGPAATAAALALLEGARAQPDGTVVVEGRSSERDEITDRLRVATARAARVGLRLEAPEPETYPVGRLARLTRPS